MYSTHGIRRERQKVAVKSIGCYSNWNLEFVCLPTEHLKSAHSGARSTRVRGLRIELEFALLVFVERGKPEYPEKNLLEQGDNQQQIQPTYNAGTGNRTRATLVGGECFHHCAARHLWLPKCVNIRCRVYALDNFHILTIKFKYI